MIHAHHPDLSEHEAYELWLAEAHPEVTDEQELLRREDLLNEYRSEAAERLAELQEA